MLVVDISRIGIKTSIIHMPQTENWQPISFWCVWFCYASINIMLDSWNSFKSQKIFLKLQWRVWKRTFQLSEINHVDIIWECTELSMLFIRNVNIFIPTLISDEILTDSAKLITGNGIFCKLTESIQVLNEGSDENIYHRDINLMSRATRVKLLLHPLPLN